MAFITPGWSSHELSLKEDLEVLPRIRKEKNWCGLTSTPDEVEFWSEIWENNKSHNEPAEWIRKQEELHN